MHPIYRDLMLRGEEARELHCDFSRAETRLAEAMQFAQSNEEMGEAKNQYALNLWHQGRKKDAENIWYENIQKYPGTMASARATAHMVDVWLSRRNLHSAEAYATTAIDAVRKLYPKPQDIPDDYVWFLGRWAKALESYSRSRLLVAKICVEERKEQRRVKGKVTKAKYAAWLERFYLDMCYAHPIGAPIYLILWLATVIKYRHWLPLYKIFKRK